MKTSTPSSSSTLFMSKNKLHLSFHPLNQVLNPLLHYSLLQVTNPIYPFFSTPPPTTSSPFNSLSQCPNISLLTRLSPYISLSSFSRTSASSSCSIKPSINFACPIPLSSCFQLTLSNSIKIFYFNARSILPKLDELSALCSVLNPDLYCGIMAIC